MSARRVAGVLLAVAGIVLIFMPLQVAAWLHRPHETSPQLINLRASWGGTILGLGAFIAWLAAPGPCWPRVVLGLLMWSMVGIGVGRAVGFVLDGGPDTLQWVWLGAEIVIAAACAWGLRRLGYLS